MLAYRPLEQLERGPLAPRGRLDGGSHEQRPRRERVDLRGAARLARGLGQPIGLDVLERPAGVRLRAGGLIDSPRSEAGGDEHGAREGE